MKTKSTTKVGLFGIGLDTYWSQFEGLLENLIKYQAQIKERIEGFEVEVIDAGMVDNPEKAKDAAIYIKTQDVDIVFLYVSTYALSSTVLPIAQKVKVPIIILNLQPVRQLDYEKFNALADRGKMTVPGWKIVRLVLFLKLQMFLIVLKFSMILLQDI